MKYLKHLITFIFCLISYAISAQNPCGYDRALTEQLKDSQFASHYSIEQEQMMNEYLNAQINGRTSRNIITIPVVVHILYRKQQGFANLTYERITSQIDALNEYFNATLIDRINNSHPYYKGAFAADCDFNFVLANKDPNGNPTTGIIRKRINSYLPDLDYTDAAKGGSTAWNTQKYLNIYVVAQLANGNLGVYYPSTPGTLSDVVFVKANSFGRDSEYTLASNATTCAHEVGHWLSLEHIFGREDALNNFCGRDLIHDTPQQKNNSYPENFPYDDDCGIDVIKSGLTGTQFIAFDDKNKRGIFGSSTGLGFFRSDSTSNASIYGNIPYNDNLMSWVSNNGDIWYECPPSCTTKTVRDIIRTNYGTYWIAMAANAAQAQGGGIFPCYWNNNGNTIPVLGSNITTNQNARYCRDLSSDNTGNIFAAFGFYLTGTTQTDGKLGKYNSISGTWQFTTEGMAPVDPNGISTRNVLNVHCDSLGGVVYASTQQAFISGTAYGPYLLKYSSSLGYIGRKDFSSIGNVLFKGIVTDKSGKVWAVYNSGTTSVLKVYDNSFNELFEFPLSSGVNNNGIKYDAFDNIYIQTFSQLIIINNASVILSINDIVDYASTQYGTPNFFSENTYSLTLNTTGLALDQTSETLYWTDGTSVNRVRMPYRANKGGRMYNNIMDYLAPDVNTTIYTEGQKDRMIACFQTKRVQMLASDGYVDSEFCPAGLPLAPVGLPYVTNLTCNAAKIQWDKNPCVDSYTLRYRKKGTTTWSFKWNIPATKTSYVLNTVNASLEPETTYQYQVLCKKAGFSDSQSIIGEFITKPALDCREDLLEEETNTVSESDIRIYPNPNSGRFTVRFENTGNDDDVLIRVINLSGQIVSETHHALGVLPTSIDLDLDLPAGYYSVIFVNSNISISKGIIISR